MKIKISRDEWWPVYTPGGEWGRECEVPEELVQRYRKVNREFDDVQDELLKIYNES